jgi:hypothetical protein
MRLEALQACREYREKLDTVTAQKERAQEALHGGNAACSGEKKQAAIVDALDALGWDGPERLYLPDGCGEGCDACPPPNDCPIRGTGILAGCVNDALATVTAERDEAWRQTEEAKRIGWELQAENRQLLWLSDAVGSFLDANDELTGTGPLRGTYEALDLSAEHTAAEVERVVQETRGGQLREICRNFVYTEEEWDQAMRRLEDRFEPERDEAWWDR